MHYECLIYPLTVQRWKEGWDQCQIRDNLDRVAEKKCLKKEGLWRKVPFSAEIFDNKRDKLMANDSGTRELFTSFFVYFRMVVHHFYAQNARINSARNR